MSFWGELKRRNVVKVGVAYAIVAWLLIQVADVVLPTFDAPRWVPQTVTFLLMLGLPIALILAWAYEVTPEGIKPSAKVDSAESITHLTGQKLNYVVIGLLVFAVAFMFVDNYVLEDSSRETLVQAAVAPIEATAPDNVLVTAQLIDAATDSHLWSDRYERELAGIFAIQADIAMNVANALNAAFSVEEQQRVERPPTTSPAAYALYLRLTDLVASNQGQLAHETLDRVIELDPGFAAAYARKASLYATTLINTTAGSARTWAELEPLVREYADRALELDPGNTRGSAALGHLSNFTWRWTEARQAYEQATALSDPSALDDGIGAPGGWFLAWSGDPDRAVTLMAPFVDVNPFFWGAHWFYGTLLQYARDYEAAAASFGKGIELAPALSLQHSWLAFAEIGRGDLNAARQALEFAEQVLAGNRAVINLVDIAYGYSRIGDAAEASRLFEEISTLAAEQDIGAGGWAAAHLAVGNVDEALDRLEQGAAKAARHEVDAGCYTLMNIKLNVAADPVLERPEFVDVRNRLRGD